MTETMTDLSLTVSRVIPAPPERVFDAWLDPKMMAKFMMGMPGTTVPKVETDPRAGGRFLILMRTDRDLPHEGTYKEITRPRRLVFTWESAHSTVEDSTVTVTFAEADGGTLVELTQVRFASEGSRDGHKAGWSYILDLLAEAV
jgi:uncharacterized protein YndB with AHSA1/START domain